MRPIPVCNPVYDTNGFVTVTSTPRAGLGSDFRRLAWRSSPWCRASMRWCIGWARLNDPWIWAHSLLPPAPPGHSAGTQTHHGRAQRECRISAMITTSGSSRQVRTCASARTSLRSAAAATARGLAPRQYPGFQRSHDRVCDLLVDVEFRPGHGDHLVHVMKVTTTRRSLSLYRRPAPWPAAHSGSSAVSA